MKNQYNFVTNLREEYLVKTTCEKYMLEAEKSCQTVDFASVSWVRPSREIVAKHSAWRIFKCDFLTLHPYYIYPHYPQKYRRPFKEKNPR